MHFFCIPRITEIYILFIWARAYICCALGVFSIHYSDYIDMREEGMRMHDIFISHENDMRGDH